MAGETVTRTGDAAGAGATDWDSLAHAEEPEKSGFSSGEAKPATHEEHEAGAEKEKSFNELELERIGRLTGRVPDDPEVIKLNLVLRYQKFQQYRALYDGQKSKHIMIQQETYEDIATAKRELEEAMYLYDETFRKRDDEIAGLTEEQRRHDIKDKLRPDKHFGEGEATTGNSWVKARIERGKVYDGKRDAVEESRQAAADRLYDSLGKMSEDIKGDEIFLTYDLYKDREPEGSISGRRDGYEAGKDGLFIVDKDGHSAPERPVDWALYPHAPKAAEAPETADEPTGEDAGEGDDKGGKGGEDKGGKPKDEDGEEPEGEGDGDLTEEERARLIEEERAKELEKEKAKRAEIEAMSEAEKNARLRELLEEKARNAEKLKKVDELIEEYDELEREKAAIDEALEADMDTPLVAVSADFTLDKKDLAHDIAERQLNEETSRAGLLKRLWKGTLFKKYYELKYTDELMEGERTVNVDGKELSVDELIAGRKDAAISRFVMSVVEDSDGYIHTKAGEKMEEADAETTAAIRGAVEKFATAKIPEGGSLDDLKREFANDMKRLKAEARDRGEDTDELIFDNYLDVAMQARMRVEHGIAMEDVMEGFKVVRAEARDGIRTEAHRDCVDKIINRIESSNAAGLVPAEVLAIAFGVTSALTQTGVRAIAGAGAGIGASTLISGLRERNRITEDRARMLRDVANGMSYEGQSADRPRSASARYEQRIGGTLYGVEKATSLAQRIEDAMKAEGDARSEATLRAIAEARVRIDFSDAERKDLISYSSEDARGKERLALDIATIRAEKSLSEDDKKKLEAMKAEIEEELTSGVDEKDADFRHMRTAMAVRKAGRTLILGASIFLVSQEAMAAMDPGKIGILEKYGIFEKLGIRTPGNADNASETLLASGFGLNRGGTQYQTQPITLRSDQQVEIDRLRANGYTETQISGPSTTTTTTLQDVSPSASTNQLRAVYDGWANNGTSYSDGNELGLHVGNGNLYATMGGTSTVNGQALDVDALSAAGRVKGYITVGGAKFEVAPTSGSGGLSWAENGVFTTTTGETIRAIGDHGEPLYQYFEVAVDNGVDADGLTHIIPLATHVGTNSFNGTMTQVVETTTTTPGLLQFVKTVAGSPRAITMEGIAFAPETARTGLGAAKAAPKPAAPAGPAGGPATDGGEAPVPAEPVEEAEEAPAEEPAEEKPAEEKPAEEAPATSSEGGDGGVGEPAPAEEGEPSTSTASAELWADVMAHSEGIPPEVLSWLKEPDRIRSDIEDSEDAKKYSEWWEKQGEATRQAVGRIINLIFKANKESLFNGGDVISDFGDSFMNWMRMNHGGYLS